jgi:hypothetical protein
MQNLFQQNPSYENVINQNNQSYSQNPNQGQGPMDGTYEIPTVVHITHNNGAENITDAQVIDAINQANNQLAGGEGGWDTKIQLVLVSFDPSGNCTSGINRVQYPTPDADLSSYSTDVTIKNLSRWDVGSYLNIWVVRDIIGSGQQPYGYAYLPTGDSGDQLVDGIVIEYDRFGNTGAASGNIDVNTLVHEFGHYANLYHVWGPDFTPNACDNCHTAANNLSLGDRVGDTEPCCTQLGSGDCSPFIDICGPLQCNCLPTNPNSVYPRDNYMSYAHACQNKLTEGQSIRMYWALDNLRETLWSDANQICTGIGGNMGKNVVINTNTNWTTTNLPNNGNITIHGTLTVESGSKLTIGSGVTVHFCELGKVIIKPNATLELSGTLTNSCDAIWKGVEVWGNSSASQYNINQVNSQGRLTCKSGSLIENADIAVQLWGPDYIANAGGIISCFGTTFKNNRRAVEFAPYVNYWPYQLGPTGQIQNYAGSFNNCTFQNLLGYINPLPFDAFLYLKGVRGISIGNCSFTNLQSIVASDIKDYGYGVYAVDAGFRVTGNSTFKRLGYAIHTANVVGNQPFTVRGATFDWCYYGIYNKSVSQGTILFNQFNVGFVPNPSLTNSVFGTFFEGAMSGFAYEENKFKGISLVVPFNYGSYSKDLGYFDGNMIRRNNYEELKFGNAAEKTNSTNNSPFRGLHYLCNTNTAISEACILVADGGRIRRDQGVITIQGQNNITFSAAGNKFISSQGVGVSNQSTNEIKYHRVPGITIEDPTTFGLVTKVNTTSTNQCAQTYCSNPPCPEVPLPPLTPLLKTQYFVKRSDYNAAKQAYDAAVASGNTAQAGQKMMEMAGARNVMDHNSLLIVDEMLNDSTGPNEDSLRTWFILMDNPAAHLQLARHYIAKGQPAQANATLAQATQLFGLSGEDATDFSNLTNIVNLIGTQSVYDLNAQTLTALDSYANGNDGLESTLLAQNIKSMYGNYYPPKYELPGTGGRSSDAVKAPVIGKQEAISLSVSPNPAKGDVLFSLSGKTESTQKMTLTVLDMTGKSVWQRQNHG